MVFDAVLLKFIALFISPTPTRRKCIRREGAKDFVGFEMPKHFGIPDFISHEPSRAGRCSFRSGSALKSARPIEEALEYNNKARCFEHLMFNCIHTANQDHLIPTTPIPGSGEESTSQLRVSRHRHGHSHRWRLGSYEYEVLFEVHRRGPTKSHHRGRAIFSP